MKTLDREKLQKNIEKLLTRSIEDKTILGGVCIVRQDSKTIADIAMGKARFDSEENMSDQHLFRLASVTKNICSITTLQQIERGKISLDTKLSDFFPGFAEKWIGTLEPDGSVKMQRKAETPLTILHLLTHRSGISTTVADLQKIGGKKDLAAGVAFAEKESFLHFEPNTHWMYSPTMGCDILAHITELLSGMPYADYVKKFVTDPLEMENMTFAPTEEQWKRMVSVMDRDANGKACEHLPSKHAIFMGIPLSYHSGGAGLVCSAEDLIRIPEMLLCGGLAKNGKRVLAEESVRKMRTVMTPKGMPGMSNDRAAFGLLVRVYSDHPWMPDGVFGWNGYYGAQLWTDPKNKIAAIYLKNTLVEAKYKEALGDNSDEACPDKYFEQAVYGAL
ncbi:MAG: beta-lactamase family protein [Christensenellaceae bacterium]|nr:beta-lactamase family protein [Christensenellaceae bacterium]